MKWLCAVIPLIFVYKEFGAGNPTPLKLPGYTHKLTPYIRHWEAANFNRDELFKAHLKHEQQARRRRKRDLSYHEQGLAHVMRLNFTAHDKDFRMVLRQNPFSVFANDVEFESTHGPIEYDISRIYTGSLEDEENSLVHAILTSDNLLDGTIETQSEQYYLEPSHRYSKELFKSGVHSIVYKVSDVHMQKHRSESKKSTVATHCASEKLRRKRRWLPNSMVLSNHEDSQNPPLPLDLEVPYNDDFRIIDSDERNNTDSASKRGDSTTGRSVERSTENLKTSVEITTQRRNIIVNNYSPANNYENRADNNYDSSSNKIRKLYTKHKNIIVSTYNRPISELDYQPVDDKSNNFANISLKTNIPNNFFNANWTTMFMENENDRPSHKTHVEIITKHGATKKPNIIVNNYNPEISLVPNPYNPSLNSMLVTNLLSGRGTDASPDIHQSPRLLYDRKTTCMLYLQADHTFFQKMGSDDSSIEAITRHVQRANSIYKITDFNNDGKPDNITFMIKRIKVHNMNAVKDPSYRFPGNYGVEKFLELFSEEDYDAFCLAYMFTYRDFEMGTLGLAWTGDLKNAGGVCEKNGHYRGSLKSLNTGIVTLLNYGKHVPPAVSHVTLAHEIGHNFGSPHDPEQCTPGGEDGNFIMFARATSGDKKNNNKFSACSLKSIEPVLNVKARSAKGCFTEPQSSICGNGVVETGEECDCGWEEDCKDSCCFPMSRQPRIDEKPCMLTPHARCSPSQGPCCTTDCKLKYGDKCRDDNGCRDPSFCDGHVPQCPPSINKPNKTICNKEFVCYMGDCTGSICLAYGLESCQCIPGPKDDRIKSCELCCKLPGEENPCRSSFEWNEVPFDVPDMYSKPGTPCNDYNGYCDVFQKCREVDPSGPLATLRKLLLSEESIATFKKWMYENWYSVAFAAVAIFILLGLSTKLLTKRSNLKLKSVTIIHSAATETVRLPDNNNGVIVHSAIRTKVPFKKKVRGERNPSKNPNKTKNTQKGVASRQTLNNDVKKPVRNKKKLNVVAAIDDEQIEKSAQLSKKTNKFGKQIKEIIDYSQRNNNDTESTISRVNHINTFGKVQKWLLESPIVGQPLSNIEHSSKAHKVISKSQSTPERMAHKIPQKTKSMGNLANEKVKLQVVYKPPFKFSLRLSKKSKVKTQVVNTARNKRFFKNTLNSSSNHNLSKDIKSLYTDRTKRNALLLCNENDEDNQILTFCEPNQEAVQKNITTTSTNREPKIGNIYENVDSEINVNKIDIKSNSNSNCTKMIVASRKLSSDNNAISTNPIQMNYASSHRRSDSMSSNKTFAAAAKRNSVKLKASGSISMNRNFGSTQNLISSSQSNLAKTKKRCSLNLKSNNSKNVKDALTQNFAHQVSTSNLNLRRDISVTNFVQHACEIKVDNQNQQNLIYLEQCTTHGPPKLTMPKQNVSSANMPLQPAKPSTRNSFSNIPRVILNNGVSNVNINSQSNGSANINIKNCTRQTLTSITPDTASVTIGVANVSTHAADNGLVIAGNARHAQPNCRNVNNSQHNFLVKQNLATQVADNELPSDLEVVVSDIENLVS